RLVPERLHLHKGAGKATARVALRRKRQACWGFWRLEDSLGRDQSISAADRGHRAALQRCGAEHSRRFHFIEVGLAGCVWSASVSGDEEVVWHAGEQLRGGGRVWPKNSCACHNGRWRERPSRISALQRRSGAVQHRRFARGLFLSRATE